MLKRILDRSLYGVGVAMLLVVAAWAINKAFDFGWFSTLSASKTFFSLAMLMAMLFLGQILAPLFSTTHLPARTEHLGTTAEKNPAQGY